MKFYFAPMEGITGYPFRNTYEAFFSGIDKYFTPFISANDSFSYQDRELRDVDPSKNMVPFLVPQVLTNDAEMFVSAIKMLTERGYHEVNLNLGCPSGTVVAKNKGSGMLRDPDRLDEFFEETYGYLDREGIKSVHISLKTRIGIYDEAELSNLIPVFNRYPFSEIIVHPRITKEFYKGSVHLEAFEKCFTEFKAPVVYNGDIFTLSAYEKLCTRFPSLHTVMLGRGLLMHPSLLREIKGGEAATVKELKAYHKALLTAYLPEMGSEKNTLFKMKEFWDYLSKDFEHSERYLREIRKATDMTAYKAAVRNLFAGCPLRREDL